MDIGLTSVHPSTSAQFFILFIAGYGIWALITIARRRSSMPGLVAVVPLLVAVPVVWLGYYDSIAGLPLGGGARGAAAAGLAETLFTLLLGAVVSTMLALLAAWRGPRTARPLGSLLAVLVVASLSLTAIGFAARIHHAAAFGAERLAHPYAGATVSAIIAIAFLGLTAWRRLAPSPIVIAVASTAVAIAAWQQGSFYLRIAMHGY